MGFKRIKGGDLKDLPPPEWLLEGILEKDTAVVLSGAPGSGKSFVALDWSFSILLGKEWLGRKTKKGKILYIVAEGGRSAKKRIEAWCKSHGENYPTNPDIDLILGAPNFRKKKEVDELIKQIGEDTFSLVVIDTLNRTFIGGDETKGVDIGLWGENIRRIQEITKSTILIIHHLGKDATRGARGHSSIAGDYDTIMEQTITKKTKKITIKCIKQKEDEDFEDIEIGLAKIPLPGGLSSCTLKGYDKALDMNDAQEKSLKTLNHLGAATAEMWRNALPGIGIRTHENQRKWLKDKGLIEKEGNRFSLTPKGTTIVVNS